MKSGDNVAALVSHSGLSQGIRYTMVEHLLCGWACGRM